MCLKKTLDICTPLASTVSGTEYPRREQLESFSERVGKWYSYIIVESFVKSMHGLALQSRRYLDNLCVLMGRKAHGNFPAATRPRIAF